MAKILYRGVKTFWKTKNSIEFVLLEHTGCDVLEIVAFEPVLCVEAPRIYLDKRLLCPLLPTPPRAGSKTSEEGIVAISTFVFNHLYISKFLPISKHFEVVVRREYEAREQKERFELMMNRPVALVPYPSPFTAK